MTTPDGSNGHESGSTLPFAHLPGPIATLLDASYAIIGATDNASLVRSLTDVLTSHGVDSFNLSRRSAGATPSMEIMASWDKQLGAGFPLGTRFQRAAHPIMELVRPGHPLIINDSAVDPRLSDRGRHLCEQRGARSIGVFPMTQGDELLGFLNVSYKTIHAFTAEEIHGFSLVAQIALSALQNIDARALLAKRAAQYSALYRIGGMIAEISDEDELFHTAASLLVSEIGYLNAWIGTVDEDARVLRERVVTGLGVRSGRPPLNFKLDQSEKVSVAVLNSGRLTVTEDAQRQADAEGWGDIARLVGLGSLGYTPLRSGRRSIGVLAVGSSETTIAEDELAMLGAFADQLTSTLIRGQMSRERERQVAALEDANASQARLLETVRELSTPVIPVHHGVVVMPLVGMIDAVRSAQVTEALLHAIQRERASVVIIDITGVPAVDAGVANRLLGSARAASLLGATCVLVGVAPAVAQTLVTLGVDLGGVVTRNDLQAGIAYALTRVGRAPRAWSVGR